MYYSEVQEAEALIARIGDMLDQVGRLAGKEMTVLSALGAVRHRLYELDAALWSVEPQADDSPIPDTVEEYYL
jgi:hypothetical protein